MTSRERVLAALDHQTPDRVPLDFSGHRSSGIHALAYARLRKYLHLHERPLRIYDVIQQMAVVDDDVLELFGVDTIELGRAFAQEASSWHDWVLPDGTPCQVPVWISPEREGNRWVLRSHSGRILAQMPDGALYFEQTYYPFLDGTENFDALPEAFAESMWTAYASPPGPIADGPEGTRRFIEGAKALRARSDRAILALFGGNLLEVGQFLYRNDVFFMLLAGEPERAHDFLEHVVNHHLRNLESFLGKVGPYVDVVVFGDDLGMQTGPQISPAMYREFFKPRHARMWKRAKELADVKVMLHCCGGVRELLPTLLMQDWMQSIRSRSPAGEWKLHP